MELIGQARSSAGGCKLTCSLSQLQPATTPSGLLLVREGRSPARSHQRKVSSNFPILLFFILFRRPVTRCRRPPQAPLPRRIASVSGRFFLIVLGNKGSENYCFGWQTPKNGSITQKLQAETDRRRPEIWTLRPPGARPRPASIPLPGARNAAQEPPAEALQLFRRAKKRVKSSPERIDKKTVFAYKKGLKNILA
jgi:hypothetical protein